MKTLVGDWVFLDKGNVIAVQKLQQLETVMVHLIGGSKYAFIGDEAEVLWQWATDGARNLMKGRKYRPTGRHAWGWSRANVGIEEINHPSKGPDFGPRKWRHAAA